MGFFSPTDPPLDGQFGVAAAIRSIIDGQFGSSGVVAWSPADLFTTEEGFYFAESDASARWQDSARTTPASSGDPLGGLTDLSGNGHHAGQSTAAARPTLTAASDKWYGVYDGTDDHMDLTIGSGIIRNVAGATFWGIVEDDLETVAVRYHLWVSRTAGAVFRKASFGRWNSAGQHGLTSLAQPSAASALSALYNKGDQRDPTRWLVTVDCTGNLMSVYLNGTLNSTSSTTITDFEDFAEPLVRIGAYSTVAFAPTNLWNGKISHVGCIDRVITSDERAELDTWLSERAFA